MPRAARAARSDPGPEGRLVDRKSHTAPLLPHRPLYLFRTSPAQTDSTTDSRDFHHFRYLTAPLPPRFVCLGTPLATCALPKGVSFLVTYLLAE